MHIARGYWWIDKILLSFLGEKDGARLFLSQKSRSQLPFSMSSAYAWRTPRLEESIDRHRTLAVKRRKIFFSIRKESLLRMVCDSFRCRREQSRTWKWRKQRLRFSDIRKLYVALKCSTTGASIWIHSQQGTQKYWTKEYEFNFMLKFQRIYVVKLRAALSLVRSSLCVAFFHSLRPSKLILGQFQYNFATRSQKEEFRPNFFQQFTI